VRESVILDKSDLDGDISLFQAAHKTKQSGLNQTHIEVVSRAIRALESPKARDVSDFVPLDVGQNVQWHIPRLANERSKLRKHKKWVADTMSQWKTSCRI
jgi:hypothetical protein